MASRKLTPATPDVGARITRARKERWISREELAARVRAAAQTDTTTKTVSTWENDGRLSVGELRVVSDILDVSIAWLLTGREETHMSPDMRVELWRGLQAAWDRLAALQRMKLTQAVRAQIIEAQEVIGISQQMLELTAEQAAALAEAADAIAGADALQADAPEEDERPPDEDEPGPRPSA